MKPFRITRRHWLAGSSVWGLSRLCSKRDLYADDETAVANDSSEPTYAEAKTSHWRFGIKIRTPVTFTNGVATFPIPMDWPEQSVTITSRDVSGPVSHVQVRDLPGGARQVVVGIARMTANSSIDVLLDYRVDRRNTLAPEQPELLVIPKKIPRDLRVFMGSSPMIDTTNSKIRALSRELAAESADDTSAWQTVRRIYDSVREKVMYVEGPIRNASDALKDGKGDCEDMTSLFVALCRNAGIPARMVWVPGHCYPEFYLETETGGPDSGHWYPCQAAGADLFGHMEEERPIMQKGDRFQVPGQRKLVRYVTETFRCDRSGNRDPELESVREQLFEEQ